MCRLTALFTLLIFCNSVSSAEVPALLRKMPKPATFVLVVEKPRAVVENLRSWDFVRGVEQFPQARELLESTQVKRFFQVVNYLERELGGPWPELLDKLAGNGIVLGIGFGTSPEPTLVIIDGTDEAIVEKAYTLFRTAVEEELARADSKEEVKTADYLGYSVMKVGKDALFARVGRSIYIANQDAAMKEGLKLAKGNATANVTDHPSLASARKLVGDSPTAWAWLDLKSLKQNDATKDFFASSKNDILQTLVIGSTVDALSRSDFVAFSLKQRENGIAFRVLLPAERKQLPSAMALHVPMNGEPGSRPLLVPKGTVYSQSFYLDWGHIWKNRKTMVNDQNLKDLEEGVKQIDKIIPDASFGDLLMWSGPYHRIVSAHTGEKLYSQSPSQVIPPSAYIVSMKNAKYGETMDRLIRSGAALLAFQTGWKKTEETVDGIDIVTYKFPETAPPKFYDPDRMRFNAAPSFAIVGNSLVLGSTPGIIKVLIPILKQESSNDGSPIVWRSAIPWAGISTLLAAFPEQTITQTILGQGIGLAEAKKQVQDLTNWLRTLGTVNITIEHAENRYEFTIEWQLGR